MLAEEKKNWKRNVITSKCVITENPTLEGKKHSDNAYNHCAWCN